MKITAIKRIYVTANQHNSIITAEDGALLNYRSTTDTLIRSHFSLITNLQILYHYRTNISHPLIRISHPCHQNVKLEESQD